MFYTFTMLIFRLLLGVLFFFCLLTKPAFAQDSAYNLFSNISGGDFYNFEPMMQKFTNLANKKTGMTVSFLEGQSAITQTGASTYDMSLWAMGTPFGRRIINTYAQNSMLAQGSDAPQTFSKGYSPNDGVLSFVRLKSFDQYGWWNTWEWSVKAGENAWIGMAALREYIQFQDPWALEFAKQRAAFLLDLQDSDGALRMGPRGQYFPYLKDGWWSIKSTENNESALYFLDQLYLVTKEDRYKNAADEIYAWLIKTMFNSQVGIFHRGEVTSGSVWRLDDINLFSADTLNCAPIERMLGDLRFGTTRLDRLNSISRMISEAEKRVGIFSKGQLVGVSFSSSTKAVGVVSPEWTSQYILLCNCMAKNYRKAGMLSEADKLSTKSVCLLGSLQAWYVKNGDALPYALYSKNGRAAESIPTGHGWDTPDSKAALASTIYYGFATKDFDPLRDLISTKD